MNWFAKLWSNPNLHIALGTAAGVAATVFPQYQAPLATAAVVLGGAGIGLPEQPATPSVVNLPPAQAGGSYHAVDYASLAAALLAQFGRK